MLNRRDFMASALAIGSLGVLPASAQRAPSYVIPPEHLPTRVRLRARVEPGEIHVDPVHYRLYWTLPGGRAIQYAVGVGRENLYEAGIFSIGAKKEWPAWTPTREMIAREPEQYAQWADGMPGGPTNPLGARALYLFTPERGDTFLRIHGTNDPRTIGLAVSNGCTRLVNDHAIDLYDRVPLGTRVVLHPKDGRGWDAVAHVESPRKKRRTRNTRNTRNTRRIRRIRRAQAVERESSVQSEPERMCVDVLGQTVRCNP